MAGVLVLNPTTVAVVPGGESVCSIKVRNTGTVVDQFTLTVLGDAAAWTTITPPVVSLFPGAEGTADIHFRPPRNAQVRAGELPFAVRAVPSEDSDGTVVEEGALNVAPFADIGARITPRTSEGKRSAKHEVIVENKGNGPVTVELDATDPDELMAFSLRPASLTILAGSSGRAEVKVAARKGFMRGPMRPRPFNVDVRPDQGNPVRLDAALNQRAGMPGFVVPLIAAAVAIGLIVAVVPLLKKDNNSGTLSLAAQGKQQQNGDNADSSGDTGDTQADQQEATASEAPPSEASKQPLKFADSGTTVPTTAPPVTAAATGAPATTAPPTTAAPTTTTAKATTTTAPTTTSTTAPPAYAKFIGTWKNANTSTGFEPQMVMRNDATYIYVHGYGACSPSYCDWGEGKTALSDASDNVLVVTTVVSNGKIVQKITYTASNQLQVHSDKYDTNGAYWYSDDSTFNKA